MPGTGGVRVDEPYRLRADTIRLSVWAVLAGWILRRLGRLLLALVRSPALLAAIGLTCSTVWVFHLLGPVPVGAAGVVLILIGLGWRWRWPDGFDRHVRLRVRGWRRGTWLYRRLWVSAATSCGLSRDRTNGIIVVPSIVRVRATCSVDRVLVRMLPGQTLDDYATTSPRLAQTFGAQDCRIRTVPGQPHRVELWLLTHDPLTTAVALFPPPVGDLLSEAGLPIAIGEDGLTWRLRLVGHHVLIVGATGAGKGSVLWSVLLGLVPAIRAGLVTVWAIDPKGGMELAPGQALFGRFCHGGLDDTTLGYETGFAELLEDAVVVMRRRQDRLRGITRLHQPSTDEPLVVVLVDELAALTGWILDRAVKKRIETALGLLLSQGRAVGVVIVGAVQDPRKDVLPMRDLFPTRIALRLNEAEQVHLVLGPGARNRGAACDLIPDTLPGVGYVTLDGIAEPVRVRFSHITDDHIAHHTGTEPVAAPLSLTTLATPEPISDRDAA